MKCVALLVSMISLALLVSEGRSAERRQTFDRDPGWDARYNRSSQATGREVRQDFGFSARTHFGGAPGEIGGFIAPVAEPAYYALPIEPKSFHDRLSASGKLVGEGGQFNALIGFFNADTLNEWRTPNTIALRVYGRGDVFYAYVEYATGKWRAGAAEFSLTNSAASKPSVATFSSGGTVHTWSLEYDPSGNGGQGTVTGAIDGQTLAVNLEPGHKADGASFNRFGLLNVMKHFDGGGELWLDDITMGGRTFDFATDPRWAALNNRKTFFTRDVRPWFDFGYSNTRFAGGAGPGEMGGLMFRGDGRHPDRMAFYGDRLEELTLERPLRASGKVSLLRAVSDSDTLIGFFHSEHSLQSGGTDSISLPPDFIGISIGGPSREGFFFAPAYRLHGTERGGSNRGPYIYPDRIARAWSFEYSPGPAEGAGRIVVALDEQTVSLDLPPGHKTMGAHFNRFGLITTHTDGNGQRIYFDDLVYTFRQE